MRTDEKGYDYAIKPIFDTLEKSKRTQAMLNPAGRNSTQFRNSN